MNKDIVYVHLETVSNMILSYGISTQDFVDSLKEMPDHLLLLTPVDRQTFVDPHTGFNVISGKEDVRYYLLNKRIEDKRWIDYKRTLYLEEFTPVEVSELLYLGHARTHLQSPFYYKLENDYVYLDLPDGSNKTYFRHLEEFYRLFNTTILRHIHQKRIEQLFWNRNREAQIKRISRGILEELRSEFLDGFVISFENLNLRQKVLQLPIYSLTNRLIVDETEWNRGDAQLIGHLNYNRSKQEWQLVLND